MPATVSHQLSATTPDDPAFEIRPSHWNQSHVITLNAAGSEISGAFGNGGGVTFGLSADGKVTASAPAAAPSPVNFSAGGASADLGSVVFSNSNGIGFGLNGSTITASHNGLTSQSNQAFSASGGSSAFQTLAFNNANGATFSNNGGSVELSYTVPTVPAQFTGGFSTNGNTAGDTGLVTGRLVLAGGNNITLSGSTNGGSATVTISGPNTVAQSNQVLSMYAVGNTTQSSSGTENASTLEFRGEGVASVGISGGSVVISVPAGGGGITNINVSAGATSENLSNVVFSNSNGVSFGLNGSTVTASVAAGGDATVSQWPYQFGTGAQSIISGTSGATGGSTQHTASLYAYPIELGHALTFNNAAMAMSGQTVAGTASATIGYWFGIYSLNGGTALSLISSAQFNAVISQNSVSARTASWWWGTNSTSNRSSISGNVSASFTGQKWMLMSTGDNSLSKGQYWIVAGHSARTTGANINSSNSMIGRSDYLPAQPANIFGTNQNTGFHQLGGAVSTTTNTNSTGFAIMPASINTTAMSAVGISATNRLVVLRSGQL